MPTVPQRTCQCPIIMSKMACDILLGNCAGLSMACTLAHHSLAPSHHTLAGWQPAAASSHTQPATNPARCVRREATTNACTSVCSATGLASPVCNVSYCSTPKYKPAMHGVRPVPGEALGRQRQAKCSMLELKTTIMPQTQAMADTARRMCEARRVAAPLGMCATMPKRHHIHVHLGTCPHPAHIRSREERPQPQGRLHASPTSIMRHNTRDKP